MRPVYQALGRIVLILLLCARVPVAVAEELSEYEVKAVCLYNFLKFITWPENSTPRGSRFNVCVLEESPFGNSLGAMQSKHAQGRTITVKLVNGANKEEVASCDVVFAKNRSVFTEYGISSGERGRLTISDLDDSGIISFRLKDRKVRFSINTTQALHSELKISSQLLKLSLTADED